MEIIPLLAEEGWRQSLTARRARSASAIARSLKRRAKPQLMVASAKRCAELTTPAAPLRWLRGILLMAHPPLLCEEGNITPP